MRPVDTEDKIRIIELSRSNEPIPKLKYEYTTSQHYQLQMSREKDSWLIKLTLKPFPKPLKKQFESELFQDHVEEPQVFAAVLKREQIGWIELGYQKWNNRMRIWEFLVKKEHRGKGVGTLLLNHAAKVAKERGARMLILETQSCNAHAIKFYLSHRFQLVGFDSAAYSNDDVEKGEFRLELGLEI